MKIGLFKYLVIISLMFVSGYLLMDVSNRVQMVEGDISDYEASIAREEESVRVLKAEWAYLNDPSRLERLISNGVGFVVPEVENIISNVSGNSKFDENIDNVVPARSPLYHEIAFVKKHGGIQ